MGTTTNGQICYGIAFEEDHEFPWDKEEYEYGINEWWKAVNGYNQPVEVYDEHGEYINGIGPDEKIFREYYDHKHDWEEKNPLPIELVNYCSLECPMYILTISASVITARRGYPTVLSGEEFDINAVDVNPIIDFCQEYNIEYDIDKFQWYLSSYWG